MKIRDFTLLQSFDEIVRLMPERTALVCGDERVGYAELAAASKRVARLVRERFGVGPGDLVAVSLEPGVDAVVALLAILRCGAAYVPLDVQNPPERIRLILEDCRPRGLIGPDTEDDITCLGVDELHQAAWDAEGKQDDPVEFGADALCYVIYTSGTTGRPKGVPITHRNVQALFAGAAEHFVLGPDDTWLLYHSLAFDFSVWELWGPLLYGGRLVIVDRWTKLDADVCARLILGEQVTVLSQTPTAFALLSEAIARATASGADSALRYVVFGGERLGMPSLSAWAERFGLDAPQLINMYGLTEATVHTTVHRLSAADLAQEESVIGRPLPGFVARVVDEDGQAAQQGELVVAGPQVSPGYLNRPEVTAARFGADPLGLRDDLLFYRTGDRVRVRDGNLVYLGRVDRQVKIRGHRLELGEIETAALALPDITEAVVVVLEEASGTTVLACGYTTRSGAPLPTRQLRAELLSRIPQYMLPARFRWFETLPLTVNGKTDSRQVAMRLRST